MRRAVAVIAAASTALFAASARANETEELRRQIEAQNELIRKQSEALQQMGDRVRLLEDERDAARAGEGDAPPVSTAAKVAAHTPGSGFGVAESEFGSLRMHFYSYVRYLNQLQQQGETHDSFGNARDLDLRNDIQFQKALVYFHGWALDPKLAYMLYVWTSNVSQGLGAQVVLAGYLQYAFNEHLTIGGGTNGLPGTRSVSGGFPLWLTVDNRTIADEFMRPSYSFGIWAKGEIVDDVRYFVMLANNMSALGVDAGQLDGDLATTSAMLTWDFLGVEYGDAFGDFEEHEKLAGRLGLRFSYSDEDAQSQPNTEGFDNVTLRLSDGNPIFAPDLFGPGVQIRNASYYMLAAEAGLKYEGYSLEGEFFSRWLDGFGGRNVGDLPVGDIEDHGFQVQASAMLLPERLQIYAAGSKVFGDYGDPWDARLGVNVFPFRNRGIRWNTEVLYVDESPVGGLSLPMLVGSEGPIFYSNFEFFF